MLGGGHDLRMTPNVADNARNIKQDLRSKRFRVIAGTRCSRANFNDGEEMPFAGHTLELVSAALLELEP